MRGTASILIEHAVHYRAPATSPEEDGPTNKKITSDEESSTRGNAPDKATPTDDSGTKMCNDTKGFEVNIASAEPAEETHNSKPVQPSSSAELSNSTESIPTPDTYNDTRVQIPEASGLVASDPPSPSSEEIEIENAVDRFIGGKSSINIARQFNVEIGT